MRDSAVEINLVWLLSLNEKLFRLVAFLSWEDLVNLGGSNRQWAIDCQKFWLVDEAVNTC